MNIHKSMQLFVELAKTHSLAAAGRNMQLSPPSASRLLNDLEEWLGQPLVRRTTRHVSLTEQGESYLPRCIEILEKTTALHTEARNSAPKIQGKLRITAIGVLIREILAPALSEFVEKHPGVEFEIDSTHQVVNFMADHIDVAFRSGELEDSTLIARKVCDVRMVLVASPSFLGKHDHPETVEDLLSLPCLISTMYTFGARWPFLKGKKVTGPISINDGETLAMLACQGLGIAYIPELYIRDALECKQLIEILPDRTRDTIPVHAVFPPRNYISAAAREFVDTVQSQFL